MALIIKVTGLSLPIQAFFFDFIVSVSFVILTPFQLAEKSTL